MAPSRGLGDDGTNKPGAVNAKLVVEASQRKLPPPEPVERSRRRTYVIFSFWLVVLFLGLPLWWHTTTVYRANLPYDQMTAWSEGKSCNPVFPIEIQLSTDALSQTESELLVRSTQSALDDWNTFPAHRLVLKSSGSLPKSTSLSVRLFEKKSLVRPMSKLRPHSACLEVEYTNEMLPASSATGSPLAMHIAEQLRSLFEEEQAILAHIMNKELDAAVMTERTSEVTFAMEALNRRETRAVKYAPSYHVTFSLLTGSHAPSNWDIEQALSTTFAPLLKLMAPLSNFTVDTQTQPYARLSASVQPKHSEKLNAWVLQREELGGFINAAEWPLSPSIGSAPTINYLLYVPDAAHSPLIVNNSDTSASSNSWLVPQWGGIAIFNPSKPESFQRMSKLSAVELEDPLLTFASHMLSLFGLPNKPAGSFPLQLQALRRILTLKLISSASASMGALARLTMSLPSISIPETVASSVSKTMQELDASCCALKAGNFERAFSHAQSAEAESEKAFFEPSMVGQVYFPDEHKVAVYLPLMGPVAVPLLLSAIKEIKGFVGAIVRRKVSP